MTNFFEPPPPPPEPELVESPQPWWGPPLNVIGAGVALDVLLTRTEDTAVSLERFISYPSGFGFTLVVRGRTEEAGWRIDESMSESWRHQRNRVEIPPERLRFGIQFADGSKATNLYFSHAQQGESPTAPVLQQRGGGGGGGRWEQDYWVWPLPVPGQLGFACEWPSQGIPFTRVEMDAGRILEAVTRAQPLWPDEDPGSEGGNAWTSLGPV